MSVQEYRIDRWDSSASPDGSELLRQMQSEGYDVYSWSDPAGAIHADHQHDDYQSHWVISGRLELSVQNVGTFVMCPGDRDFVPVGTVHAARVISDEPAVYLIGSLTI